MEDIDSRFMLKAFKEGRVKEISNSLYKRIFEVDNHIVVIQVKPGRQILTCDCTNHSKFNDSNAHCWHKKIVLNYDLLNYLFSKSKELISFYSTCEEKEFNSGVFVNDLKDILRGG